MLPCANSDVQIVVHLFKNSIKITYRYHKNMDKTLRCLSWVAVSSDEQARDDKISLPEQHNGNVKFIESIATLYPGYSGLFVGELKVTDSRKITLLEDARARYPQYQQLFDMIRGRQIDLLVCHKWDRLGRTESLVITIRDLCLDNNIVVIARESMPNTLDVSRLRVDEGYRVSGIIQAWGAGHEIRRLSQRTQQGRVASVHKHAQFMGPLPYGYRHQYDADGTKRVVIQNDEARTVRHALLDLYIGKGWGQPAIADELNRQGIPSPTGAEWGITSVAMLIRRARVYAGYTEFNRLGDADMIQVRGHHPPILSEDDAAKVEADAVARSSGTRRVHPFTNICECVHCGGTMYTHRRQRRPATKAPYMVHRMRCYACGYSIREDYIIDALHETIDAIAESGSALTVDDEDRIAAELGAQIRRINDGIADNERAIERLLDAFEVGDIDRSRLQKRMRQRQDDNNKLRVELAQRSQEIAAYQNTGKLTDRVDDIRRDGHDMVDLARTEPVEVQRWMRTHFRIWISKDGIERIRVL